MTSPQRTTYGRKRSKHIVDLGNPMGGSTPNEEATATPLLKVMLRLSVRGHARDETVPTHSFVGATSPTWCSSFERRAGSKPLLTSAEGKTYELVFEHLLPVFAVGPSSSSLGEGEPQPAENQGLEGDGDLSHPSGSMYIKNPIVVKVRPSRDDSLGVCVLGDGPGVGCALGTFNAHSPQVGGWAHCGTCERARRLCGQRSIAASLTPHLPMPRFYCDGQ